MDVGINTTTTTLNGTTKSINILGTGTMAMNFSKFNRVAQV